jgi:lambda family phage tail tape measure protein
MANIARLGVVLGLNTAEFQTGLSGAMRGLNKLKTGVLAAGAAALTAATGLAYLTKQSINNMDALAKQAQMAGVTVESLSGLSYAADLAGVSQDTLTTSMARLSKGMSDAAMNTGEALKGFQALNIDVSQLKSADDALLQIAERFAGFEDGANKTALAISLFGRAGAQLIPFLNSGKAGIEELRIEAEKLGIVIGTETAKQAETFNDSLTRLNAIQQGLVNNLARDMLPTLNAFTQALFDGYMRADELRSELGMLTTNNVPSWVRTVGYGFALMADGIGNTVKAVVAFIKILGLAVDGVDLIAANYVKILAISDGANKIAGENLAAARQKFETNAAAVSDTFKNLANNAFTFTDAFSTAMRAVEFPEWDTGFANMPPIKRDAPKLSGKDTAADKIANMLKEAKLISAEFDREQKHSLNMLRIKSEMVGLTENERRVQETVNDVLNATSKKLQEIADKREAAAGRDASAEVLAEYDKQAEAVQRLGDMYVELARKQEESAIAAQQTFSFGWNTAFKQYAEDAENYATMAKDMFGVLTGAMSTAIDNFVENGKFSFKDFAGSIIKDLIKIELKMQAMQLFRMGVGAIMGAFSGGIGGATTIGSGSLAGGAGALSFPVRANGGTVSADSPYMVGERGAELFVPGRSGTVIPNNNLGGLGGTTNITNNYIDAIDTKSFEDRIYGSSRAVWSANQFASKSISNNRSRT